MDDMDSSDDLETGRAGRYLTALPHERLREVFVEGRVVRADGTTFTQRLQHVGDLILTSGDVIAWDPFWVERDTPPFMTRVEPGRYPVVITAGRFATGLEGTLYATLRLSDQTPVEWDVAWFDDGTATFDPAAGIPGYPVDTGKGAFMDRTAARILAQRMREDRAYKEMLRRGMQESEALGLGWAWGTHSLEPDT